MNFVIAETTMASPNIAGIIERPRLLAKLEAALRVRVTLISAPPGYGKTTLAAQFVQHMPHPVAWHALEERERDLRNLFRDVGFDVDKLLAAVAGYGRLQHPPVLDE